MPKKLKFKKVDVNFFLQPETQNSSPDIKKAPPAPVLQDQTNKEIKYVLPEIDAFTKTENYLKTLPASSLKSTKTNPSTKKSSDIKNVTPIKIEMAKLTDFFLVTGKKPKTDGVYRVKDKTNITGFLSPEKQKVFQSQETIHGPSTEMLIEEISKQGWRVKNKIFESPINLVEINGRIYTYDHRRFEAARRLNMHVPFILHNKDDYRSSNETWEQAIKNRINNYRNSNEFKKNVGSRNPPIYLYKNRNNKENILQNPNVTKIK